ncbi:hypothetical protein C5167_012251 [Papaver somniferum]|uniref:Uncharacterized protein n=1 Tax=Papaver somniferum TaxID=3469 RepID=A0A4Y7J162_PAPSO|nr:hypothetical protein C5167_012251 [Papaver somniferum]
MQVFKRRTISNKVSNPLKGVGGIQAKYREVCNVRFNASMLGCPHFFQGMLQGVGGIQAKFRKAWISESKRKRQALNLAVGFISESNRVILTINFVDQDNAIWNRVILTIDFVDQDNAIWNDECYPARLCGMTSNSSG